MIPIIEDLSELVYIIDMDTYELLYINRAGREMFHISDWKGLVCYKALQNKEEPCEFCTNPFLKEEQCYQWNFFNPVVKRHYVLKDRSIIWEGRPARLEIAFDVTELEKQKADLEYSLKVENVVTSCAKSLADLRDIDRALDKVLKNLGEFLESDRVFLFEIKGNTMDNTHEWCAPGVSSQLSFCRNMPVDLIKRWIPEFNSGGCMVIEDVEALCSRYPNEYEVLSTQQIHCLIAAPLIIDGILAGYVGVDNFSDSMRKSTVSLLSSAGYFISSILLHRRMTDYDMLTGIRNRNAFMRDIKKAGSFPMGVVYVDINGMKALNDRYGHGYGDEVLLEAVHILLSYFGKDCCYRVGGDEFVIVDPSVPRCDFEQKVRGLKHEFSMHSRCHASVGRAWSNESDFIENLIFLADEQMYLDKKGYYRRNAMTGRYRHDFDDILGMFRPGELENRISQGCFKVFYQPKISLGTLLLSGAEALARYFDDGGREHSPAQFIPYMEDAGTIHLLDFYIFEQVCSELKEWMENGLKPVPVSVNFSRFTLGQPTFADRIQSIREKYHIPVELLEIEVTETIEASDRRLFHEVLQRLQKKRFKIAIDDFGVSFANVTLLTEIDFDILKLDKHLIDNLLSSSKTPMLVDSLTEICHKLGVRVVAEGVERPEQLDILKNAGCDDAQGYLFSRPISSKKYLEKYYLYKG